MSLKKKLMTTISLMCLTVVMLVVGVWALKTVNFTVGGNISFTAKGINATISAGTLSSTGLWVTESDASEKMKEVVINTDKTEEQLASEFATWQGLNLLFNENGDDVTITFSITNNSTKANECVGVSVTINQGTMTNATASISKSSAYISAGQSQEFVITFAITNKTIDASLTGFQIAFNLELTDSAPVDVNDVSYLTFSYDDSTMTASVTDCDTSVSSVEIPARIIYNSKTYDVTSIADASSSSAGAFYGCSSLASIIIPDSVTKIGNYAFSNCDSLTNVTLSNSITSIGESAFIGCHKLTSITIPEKVTSIENFAFYVCNGLTIVYVDSATIMQNFSSTLTYMFNYTQYVYVREDINVTSSYFTEITSDVEGYKKYTETYFDHHSSSAD